MAFKLGTWLAEGPFQKWLIVINILFGLFGTVMIIMGILGIYQADELSEEAGGLLDSFDTDSIAVLVIICGVGTVVTAFCGFTGAYQRLTTRIKAYATILFLTFCMEIGMAIYMYGLDADDAKEYWFEDTADGYELRESVQTYFSCCGWDLLTDSMPLPGGGLGPACHDYAIRLTCLQASRNWIDEWIYPAALLSLIVISLETVSLVAACTILFTVETSTKVDGEDEAFDY
jgi:hypothetical protein